MTKSFDNTMRSLLTKLSAVRMTLADDERSFLDQLIIGSTEEVEGHARLLYMPDEIKAFEPDEAKAMGLQFKPDEVKAFEPDDAKAMGLQFKPDEVKAFEPDEAKAMGLQFKPDEVKAMGLQFKSGSSPVAVKIIYDAETESYKLI